VFQGDKVLKRRLPSRILAFLSIAFHVERRGVEISIRDCRERRETRAPRRDQTDNVREAEHAILR